MTEAQVVNSIDELPEEYRLTAQQALDRVKMTPDPGVRVPGEEDAEEPPFVPTETTYDIGGVKYVFRDLVVGQEKQIVRLFREAGASLGNIDADVSSPEAAAASAKRALAQTFQIDSLLGILEGDALNRFFAILLTPEGMEVKDKKLTEIGRGFEWSLDLTTQSAVLARFFEVGEAAIDRIVAALGKGKRQAKKPASG